MTQNNLINYQLHVLVQKVSGGNVPGADNSEEFLKNANDEAGVHRGENRHLFLSEDGSEVYNMGFVDYL